MRYYQQWVGKALKNNIVLDAFPAEVPGNIQNDYGKYKKFGNVSQGTNCTLFSAMENYTWQYCCNPEIKCGTDERVYYVSHGTDYYCSVSLNNRTLLEHEGMFSDIEIDITDYLSDINEFTVTIMPHPKRKSAVKGTRDEADTSVKPPVCYGWDWHPRLLVSGIWQDTYFEVRKPFFIHDYSYTYELSDDFSSVDGSFKVECDGPVEVTVFEADGRQVYSGDGKAFHISKVSLWWCNGQGEPYLYKFSIKSRDDTVEGRIGFRKIELWMDNSEWGKPKHYPMSRTNPPTCIVLNGRKIFAKGSNFVTPEIFSGTVDRRRYEELLSSVHEANMNILRMWGGCGIQKNIFYELCDELGLMIWQEFPLACNRYGKYDVQHYCKVLTEEAHSIVRRLHKHPCLVLLCGGNELFNNWSLMTEQSIPLRILDSICLELCPEIPFIMTSPLSGMAHGPYQFWNEDIGDVFEAFQNSEATAYTEFGIPSLSPPEYLQTFIPEKSIKTITSESGGVWMLHHAFKPNGPDNQKLFDKVLSQFRLPRNSVGEIYKNSNWLQCEGLKAIFEEARRQWPTCCMAINWFFNEPWKVAVGNSLVLYPNQKKPAYEFVKQALRPVEFSAKIPKFAWKAKERFTAEIWLLNDTGFKQAGMVDILIEIDGRRIKLGSWDTGMQDKNCLGPTVNFILPECDAETLKLILKSHGNIGNEYVLRFYPTYKKEKALLREMNSTNDF